MSIRDLHQPACLVRGPLRPYNAPVCRSSPPKAYPVFATGEPIGYASEAGVVQCMTLESRSSQRAAHPASRNRRGRSGS
ncbi:hypothetical protein L665_02550 [Ralstonia solanacearum SD54]|nr:hypothetical protein F504_382 [Ralstonia pseudosolanacearum FQY_4]ANH34447.1 hypothetical protein A3768_3325 [Ralstonia solanacearum]ARU22034.1 TetR family transcriptional regulator [Ralstonia solanacearum]ESS48224.1 hypothetical protein L665_02550 [Ralstonia solanacearum SD54]